MLGRLRREDPGLHSEVSSLLENIKTVNAEANPIIERLALRLATGAETTVMAMLIACRR